MLAEDPAAPTLAGILAGIGDGRFPPPDGGLTIIPQPTERDCGILGLTAHAVVFADVDPDWVRCHIPADDLSAPLKPGFVLALGARTGRRPGSLDQLSVAAPRPGPPGIEVRRLAHPGHPRVRRALRYRDEVRAWSADGGVLLVGRGVAGRWEVAIEVDPRRRGRGLGRDMALAARHLVPPDATLWAQVAPANAASVRAFRAAGYAPVGAEILLTRS